MKDVRLTDFLTWTGISLLIVFPLLFLGAVHIGPLSVRMILAYGLLCYVLWRGKTDYMPTRGIQLYFVYLAVYILVNLLNLTAFSTEFIKDLIAVHICFPTSFQNGSFYPRCLCCNYYRGSIRCCYNLPAIQELSIRLDHQHDHQPQSGRRAL